MSIPLWNAVWKASMPHTRKLVALSLADQADEAGECYPSVSMTVERCGMSERAVQGSIADLVAWKVVERVFRKGRSTTYVFTDPRSWCTPAGDAPPQEMHPTPAARAPLTPAAPAGEGAPDAPPPPQLVHPTPARGAPITTNESPIESPLDLQTDSADVGPTFADFWREYPTKVAKPQCEAKWKSKGCAAHAAEILADVAKRKTDDRRWLDGYIPNPLTYLNQERWRDPIAPRAGPPPKPSVAEKFAGKTYTGTPEHELPAFLRSDAA